MSTKPFQSRSERITSTELVRLKASAAPHNTVANTTQTEANTDEANFGAEGFPASFTKGLRHNENGVLISGYQSFKNAINAAPAQDFQNLPPNGLSFQTRIKKDESYEAPEWRGWESPRTGHYHDLEGPDADAVGMAAAPRLGSTELSLEMAEVYSMALLRDVPFTEFELGTGQDEETAITTQMVVETLNDSGLFSYLDPALPDNLQTNRRIAGRMLDAEAYDIDSPTDQALPAVTADLLFRGSGPGAKRGHFVSQFMLVGNSTDGTSTPKDPKDGFIRYGNQLIDQRGLSFTKGIDHMINWQHWLDVQNGANLGGTNQLVSQNFIRTPRDIATYVRFDALYQAYLNACLLLLSIGYPSQEGFPEQNDRARTGFASFGGPHILSLMTEVATRALKAARRQKFNFHRRARPERIAGLLTLAAGRPMALGNQTKAALDAMRVPLGRLLPMVATHNEVRLAKDNPPNLKLADQVPWLDNGGKDDNHLLPMAFAEGSPMHPAYAAGHATVAGACVTMLKAFFKTWDTATDAPVPWTVTELGEFTAPSSGDELTPYGPTTDLSVEGELNKLAANISVARNMAGVHYYSDYYDSLRMGERISVGILMEQMVTYEAGENIEIVFRSYDGDLIKMNSTDPFNPEITHKGRVVSYIDWVTRHVNTA
ncbi:MAG: vanadium-dependent haloperoxidase [Pseudomonadota bacterium]